MHEFSVETELTVLDDRFSLLRSYPKQDIHALSPILSALYIYIYIYIYEHITSIYAYVCE